MDKNNTINKNWHKIVMQVTRIVFLLLLLNYTDAVIFKFTNAVCQSYDKRFIINNCRLKAIKRNQIVFNYNVTALDPIHNITIHTKFLKKANGYKPWVIDFTLDGCRFHKKNYNPLAIMMFKMFKEYSNINHTCPYTGTLLITGFYLKPELMLLPWPTGDYLADIIFHLNNKLTHEMKLYFTFVEDILSKKEKGKF